MKVKKMFLPKTRSDKRKKTGVKFARGILLFALLAVFCMIPLLASRDKENVQERQVFAAAESGARNDSIISGEEKYQFPTGIAGVVSGVQSSLPGRTVERLGTSCERMLVGQRACSTRRSVEEWNLSESLASKVDELDSAVVSLSASPTIMSDADYDTLLRIVEAESGGEDLIGRILVANVIMNRVKHEEFPDTVTEVVWEYDNGVPQFSPTYDGRIGQVVVSEETKEAVKQALEGVDYSQGALFFIQKSAAEKDSVSWFEKDLKKLFKHGVHEFYTYPEENEKEETGQNAKEEAGSEGETSPDEKSAEEEKADGSPQEEELIQMVKE